MRIYFSLTTNEGGKSIILLIEGNKNFQKSDILKAKKIIVDLGKV